MRALIIIDKIEILNIRFENRNGDVKMSKHRRKIYYSFFIWFLLYAVIM